MFFEPSPDGRDRSREDEDARREDEGARDERAAPHWFPYDGVRVVNADP